MFAPKPFGRGKGDGARDAARRPHRHGQLDPERSDLGGANAEDQRRYTSPPPEGFISPMAWGIESNVAERFVGAGMRADNVSFARDTYTFHFPYNPAGSVEAFRLYYGPTMDAFAAAEQAGRAGELRKELVALFDHHNTSARNDIKSIPATFLRVTIALDTANNIV